MTSTCEISSIELAVAIRFDDGQRLYRPSSIFPGAEIESPGFPETPNLEGMEQCGDGASTRRKFESGAVRLVHEHEVDHESQWPAFHSRRARSTGVAAFALSDHRLITKSFGRTKTAKSSIEFGFV
jgi:hypothetical protein